MKLNCHPLYSSFQLQKPGDPPTLGQDGDTTISLVTKQISPVTEHFYPRQTEHPTTYQTPDSVPGVISPLITVAGMTMRELLEVH